VSSSSTKDILSHVFEYSPELHQQVLTNIQEVCYADVKDVDCDQFNLWYRPISGACNNKLNAKFGTPNIAQLRLARPFFEHGKFRL